MKTSWLIGIAILFIIGQILSNIAVEADPLSADVTTPLQRMTEIVEFDGGSFIANAWQFVSAIPNFFFGLFLMLSWNYSYLKEGSMEYVWWIVCLPLSIGFIASVSVSYTHLTLPTILLV